jgi:hypothetical protein
MPLASSANENMERLLCKSLVPLQIFIKRDKSQKHTNYAKQTDNHQCKIIINNEMTMLTAIILMTMMLMINIV